MNVADETSTEVRPRKVRARAITILLTFVVVFGIMPETSSAASNPTVPVRPRGSDRTCQGEGCTQLYASRSGQEVDASAYGYSYKNNSYVWVHLQVMDAATGAVLWNSSTKERTNNFGKTPTISTMIDCSGAVWVKAWTWVPKTNVQPEAFVLV